MPFHHAHVAQPRLTCFLQEPSSHPAERFNIGQKENFLTLPPEIRLMIYKLAYEAVSISIHKDSEGPQLPVPPSLLDKFRYKLVENGLCYPPTEPACPRCQYDGIINVSYRHTHSTVLHRTTYIAWKSSHRPRCRNVPCTLCRSTRGLPQLLHPTGPPTCWRCSDSGRGLLYTSRQIYSESIRTLIAQTTPVFWDKSEVIPPTSFLSSPPSFLSSPPACAFPPASSTFVSARNLTLIAINAWLAYSYRHSGYPPLRLLPEHIRTEGTWASLALLPVAALDVFQTCTLAARLAGLRRQHADGNATAHLQRYADTLRAVGRHSCVQRFTIHLSGVALEQLRGLPAGWLAGAFPKLREVRIVLAPAVVLPAREPMMRESVVRRMSLSLDEVLMGQVRGLDGLSIYLDMALLTYGLRRLAFRAWKSISEQWERDLKKRLREDGERGYYFKILRDLNPVNEGFWLCAARASSRL